MPKYNRILLKLSGEALMGNNEYGIDKDRINEYADQIIEVVKNKVQVAIVIGGGNIFRGVAGLSSGIERVKGDYMGMLATVINSIALQAIFESKGHKARLFTSFKMEPVGEGFSKHQVMESLENNEIAILSGGTGNPYFTTDTAAALRAVEIGADVLLKGTRVDGVYTDDPEKNPGAEKFDEISFDEAYKKNLKIMDLTAFTLCQENNLPIIVFDMNKNGNLQQVVQGKKIGTLVR